MTKKYKPLLDKLFWLIWIPTSILLILATIISVSYVSALIILLATDVFSFYFMLSSIAGYVELRESSLFIKFGFVVTREIPYEKITKISKMRRFYTDSLLSLKNSMEHVDIRYNSFDTVCVSVVGNDELIEELEKRISLSRKA